MKRVEDVLLAFHEEMLERVQLGKAPRERFCRPRFEMGSKGAYQRRRGTVKIIRGGRNYA